MAQTSPDNPAQPAPLGELRNLLIGSGLFEGINLHISEQDGRAQLYIMAISTADLGVLLATLSDPGEIDDPDSLTCRITPGDLRAGPGLWQYELIAARYPTDNSIVLAAKMHIPVTDVPEVISRLRQRQ